MCMLWVNGRDLPRHVRVHVANICERPLGQCAESRCRRGTAYHQSCVSCSRSTCHILVAASRRMISHAYHTVVSLVVAPCVISHVCYVVASLSHSCRRATQEQSWRLSHCRCRDRRVYCHIAACQSTDRQCLGQYAETCSDMLV